MSLHWLPFSRISNLPRHPRLLLLNLATLTLFPSIVFLSFSTFIPVPTHLLARLTPSTMSCLPLSTMICESSHRRTGWSVLILARRGAQVVSRSCCRTGLSAFMSDHSTQPRSAPLLMVLRGATVVRAVAVRASAVCRAWHPPCIWCCRALSSGVSWYIVELGR